LASASALSPAGAAADGHTAGKRWRPAMMAPTIRATPMTAATDSPLRVERCNSQMTPTQSQTTPDGEPTPMPATEMAPTTKDVGEIEDHAAEKPAENIRWCPARDRSSQELESRRPPRAEGQTRQGRRPAPRQWSVIVKRSSKRQPLASLRTLATIPADHGQNREHQHESVGMRQSR